MCETDGWTYIPFPMDLSIFLGRIWGTIRGLSTFSGRVWIHRVYFLAFDTKHHFWRSHSRHSSLGSAGMFIKTSAATLMWSSKKAFVHWPLRPSSKLEQKEGINGVLPVGDLGYLLEGEQSCQNGMFWFGLGRCWAYWLVGMTVLYLQTIPGWGLRS